MNVAGAGSGAGPGAEAGTATTAGEASALPGPTSTADGVLRCTLLLFCMYKCDGLVCKPIACAIFAYCLHAAYALRSPLLRVHMQSTSGSGGTTEVPEKRRQHTGTFDLVSFKAIKAICMLSGQLCADAGGKMEHRAEVAAAAGIDLDAAAAEIDLDAVAAPPKTAGKGHAIAPAATPRRAQSFPDWRPGRQSSRRLWRRLRVHRSRRPRLVHQVAINLQSCRCASQTTLAKLGWHAWDKRTYRMWALKPQFQFH